MYDCAIEYNPSIAYAFCNKGLIYNLIKEIYY